ncbi:ABC transporter permease [Nocardioides szechwanensis]|uniref:ABC-2 type transport system permease protein n=1 Tax=Nocardioides szechwanensis TaxID=1005944 RepID=A0A1H0EDF8_9ACTN|nr:ABC transporter permease subunit [Nocardioides szechwanensis]GEP34704.1 ABC transporter permease [Nocardioides szechwanensis]SDN80464.1 ABC-2 type transport system permease protein [Nocardioides szechwanensis]
MISRTIVRLGVRSVFGRWRGALLFVLPLVLIAVSVLVRVLVGENETGAQHTLQGLGLVVIVPLVALLATSGLLAPEIDDGSVSYLLAKPISRYTIVMSKLVVAAVCVVVFAAVPLFIAGLVMLTSSPSLAVGFGVGSVAGGLAYCALFALLSVMSRHAVVIGLIYLLIWEGLLGGLLDGVRWLSITRWSEAVIGELADLELVEDLPVTYAVIATAVVLVLGTWLTGQRLRAFNLTGDE